ncbi:MAG: lysozyme inhibitor LprI family protein [Proteobacteria bacterium]|nr:lysozyme inhibitor LprI family protein [Pseudomonadota bacterium]
MRNKLVICAALLLLFDGPVYAQKLDCKNAVAQQDMNICVDEDFKKSDAKLNAIYRALMGKLEGKEKDELKAAQRAWLSYRDAECTFTIRENEGGTIYPMMWSGCLKQKTDVRIKELQEHLDCVNGKKSCTE